MTFLVNDGFFVGKKHVIYQTLLALSPNRKVYSSSQGLNTAATTCTQQVLKELPRNNEKFVGKCHRTNGNIILVHAYRTVNKPSGKTLSQILFPYQKDSIKANPGHREIHGGIGKISQFTWDVSKALSNQWPHAPPSGEKSKQVGSELVSTALVSLTCTPAEAAISC